MCEVTECDFLIPFINLKQVDDVSGDLVLNRGNSEFWSFHDVHSSDLKICGDLTGPMAIIISEETPRKILVSFSLSWLLLYC